MKILVRILTFVLVIAVLTFFYVGHRNASVSSGALIKPAIEEKRPDLVAVFTRGNYQQWIDRFGTVSRTAFDASGKRIGTQVGHVGGPNGIVVDMTYLEPDADNPLGQAFDGAGNPRPLHTGPETPDRDQQGRLVS
jgi:hypothetical protein